MQDKINKRIQFLGLRKNHVAKRIGVTPAELSHFLNKRRKLREDAEFKLIQLLGLN
jgi:plasmid maintenance system antidote protein VapI